MPKPESTEIHPLADVSPCPERGAAAWALVLMFSTNLHSDNHGGGPIETCTAASCRDAMEALNDGSVTQANSTTRK